jgi:hypothetical protein
MRKNAAIGSHTVEGGQKSLIEYQQIMCTFERTRNIWLLVSQPEQALAEGRHER